MESKSAETADVMPVFLPSVGRLLNFSTTSINRMCNAMLAEHGLTLAQWVVLSALWREDGLPITELARYSQNDVPAASRIVNRMESDGTVKRRKDNEDGRSVRVFLTAKGRAQSHLLSFYADVNDVLLRDFTADEREQLFNMLERIVENASTPQA